MPGGNFDGSLAVESGHIDFRAEGGLDETDRHLAEQVVAVALEDFVRADVEDHVEIARRGRRASRPRRCRQERRREPVSTPAGMRSLILEVRSRRPWPRQTLQGLSITRPAPWQCGQVWAMLKMPRELMTWPRPPQVGQVLASATRPRRRCPGNPRNVRVW